MTSMLPYVPGNAPLVLDLPRSGTIYRNDFACSCALPTPRRAEDVHLELHGFALLPASLPASLQASLQSLGQWLQHTNPRAL
jgi:hypothetical protein